ncbi:MAG: hypothetical protein ACP5MM_06235 [Acidithiobacillus sp.]|uniref:hypothetical protein n=1 Tax=Acidithiobacillus sp. TaxID=1872118 RepID=UPI003D059AD8
MRLQDVEAALSDIENLLDDKKREHAKTEQEQSEANAFRQQAQCVLENTAAQRVWFPRKELLNENAIRDGGQFSASRRALRTP